MNNNIPETIDSPNKKQRTDNIPTQNNSNGFWREIIKFAILAAVIVVPIRMYVASPFIVSGSSMDPTFETGDYIIVDQISYLFENPKRGEVIVFRYPKDPSKFFIKRVIGLPGETVLIKNGNITIKEDGSNKELKLSEPYIEFKKYDNLEVTLGNDEYFVMGDNRKASADSRLWGALPENLITGRAIIRLFPITQASISPGKYNY